jgi:hypothetical protein
MAAGRDGHVADAQPAHVSFVTDTPCAVTVNVSDYTNSGGQQHKIASGTTPLTIDTQPSSSVTFAYQSNVTCAGEVYNLDSAKPSSPMTSGSAGGTATVSGHYVPADTFPPTTTASATASSNPYASGSWTNQSVSISLSATDNTGGSGVKQITYSATGAQPITSITVLASSATVPTISTEGTTTVSYYATDNAGNIEVTKTFTVKIDTTAPSVTITPSPAPNINGWFTSAVTFTASATDSGSGVASCDAPSSYSGPDTSTGSVTLHCVDKAGNSGSATYNFKYEGTALNVTATPDRPADSNGWYNHAVNVTFAATNTPTSGGVTCDPMATYNGPDSGTASVTGKCTDAAGNSGSATFNFKYDATAPTITAASCTGTKGNMVGGTQWYLSAVSCGFTSSDTASGLADNSKSSFNVSSGTNEGNGLTLASGQVCDLAGNCATSINSGPFAIELTGPQIAFGAQSPSANGYGWNNTDVSFTYMVSNSPVSGIDTSNSTPSPVVIKTEGSGVTGSATVYTFAGNHTTANTPAVNIDKTKPTLSAGTCTGTKGNIVGTTQWYLSAVSCGFTSSDALSGLADTSKASFNVTSGTNEGTAINIASGQVCDKAGNCADSINSGPFAIELTGPQIAFGSQSPTANSYGWNNSDVSFTYTVSNNPVSGIDTSNSTPSPVLISGEGQSLTGSATVYTLAGNHTTANTPAVNIDKTKPTITYVSRIAPNGAGWNNMDVTVNWSCSDSLSGPVSNTVSQTVTTEGMNESATGTCQDRAGNTASDTQGGINLDKTPPTITVSTRLPAANSYGWNNTSVTVSFTCSDSLSGIASCSNPQTVSTEGVDQSVTGTATDVAGNIAKVVQSGINIDETAPTVTCPTTPVFILNQPGATLTPQVSDTLSGAVSPSPVTVSDAAVGNFNVSLTGSDEAGNSATKSCSYQVNFGNAIGFYQPWAPPPGTAFKAGSTIPLKWQWTDYNNKPVDSGSVVPNVYQDAWCSSSPTVSTITLDDAGTSGYQYDPTTFTWQYNWKTPKNGAGLCYALNVKGNIAGGLVGDKPTQLR